MFVYRKKVIKLFNFLFTHTVCMMDALGTPERFWNKWRFPMVLCVLLKLNKQLKMVIVPITSHHNQLSNVTIQEFAHWETDRNAWYIALWTCVSSDSLQGGERLKINVIKSTEYLAWCTLIFVWKKNHIGAGLLWYRLAFITCDIHVFT